MASFRIIDPTCIFKTSIDPDQKRRVADTMLSCEPTAQLKSLKRHGSGFGKSTLPEIPVEPTEAVSAYIGEDSWIFFQNSRH